MAAIRLPQNYALTIQNKVSCPARQANKSGRRESVGLPLSCYSPALMLVPFHVISLPHDKPRGR
jgi:hypothetical protein